MQFLKIYTFIRFSQEVILKTMCQSENSTKFHFKFLFEKSSKFKQNVFIRFSFHHSIKKEMQFPKIYTLIWFSHKGAQKKIENMHSFHKFDSGQLFSYLLI